jgi:hypothetical protein
MDIALLVSRLILAAVFAVAGIGKLMDREAARRALGTFGLPPRAAIPLASTLPVGELAIAGALIAWPSAPWPAIASGGLLCVFTAVIAVNLLRGRRPTCQCFGSLHSAPIGLGTVGRNLALVALAAFVTAGTGISDAGWVAGLAPFKVVAGAASAVAIVLAVLTAHSARRTRARAAGDAPDQHATTLQTGATAPAFAAMGADGRAIRLSELIAAGKPVVLVFSNPRCGACTALLPTIALWQRQLDDEVSVRVVTPDGDGGDRRALPEGSILDEDGGIARLYEVHATPSAVLVRSDGTLGSDVVAGDTSIRELIAAQGAVGLGGNRMDSEVRAAVVPLPMPGAVHRGATARSRLAWARPVSRRRSLQIGAAAAVGAFAPRFIRPRRVIAQPGECLGQYPIPCGSKFCCAANAHCVFPGTCPPHGQLNIDALCCLNGQHGCKNDTGCWCCDDDQICAPGTDERRCINRCAFDTTPCGKECCEPYERCYLGGCIRGCAEDEQPCGRSCCARGQTCQDGHCVCLHETCGGDCCPPGWLCCGSSREAGICCTPEGARQENKAICSRGALQTADVAADTSYLTAIASLGGLVPAVGTGAISGMWWKMSTVLAKCAADPPDPHYRRLARPTRRHIPDIRPSGSIDADAAHAMTSYVRELVYAADLLGAFVKSLERAQGAARADNETWARRQTLAAAHYAQHCAAVLDREEKLRRRLRRALRTSGVHEVAVTGDQVREAQRRIREDGLPSPLRDALHVMGVSRRERVALRQRLLSADPDRLAKGHFELGGLATPVASARPLAATLRRFARRAKRRPLRRRRSATRRRAARTLDAPRRSG